MRVSATSNQGPTEEELLTQISRKLAKQEHLSDIRRKLDDIQEKMKMDEQASSQHKPNKDEPFGHNIDVMCQSILTFSQTYHVNAFELAMYALATMGGSDEIDTVIKVQLTECLGKQFSEDFGVPFELGAAVGDKIAIGT